MASKTIKNIVLVTGGTNGIGLDTVKSIVSASPDNHVIIGARNLTKGETVLKDLKSKSDIKGTLSLVELDYTSDSTLTSAAQHIESEFGRLDVLINNGGICPEGGDTQFPTRAEYQTIFETNVFGPSILTGHLTPLLKKSSAPKIINVSSSLGSIALQSAHSAEAYSAVKYPAYRMSKAALNMLTAYEHFQFKDSGLKVWTYCPGYVVTDLGGDREDRIRNGIESSETSAQGILEILEGKRDAEVGRFVTKYGGRYDW